jgi:molybdopterin synthase catalytic subunit
MNNKEIVCYLLGTIGDVTRDEAIEALKHYTELSEQELNNIINEIKQFNDSFLQKYKE